MKKQPKLTPWFPAHVTPARAGLYETRFVGDFDAGFSMWFGDGWGSEYSNPSVAARFKAYGHQQKEWRGLAVKP
jgi:hypothetical protein